LPQAQGIRGATEVMECGADFWGLNWYRRLSQDNELLVEMSEPMIQGAPIQPMLRRLAKLNQHSLIILEKSVLMH
jgi:hypothetical protein